VRKYAALDQDAVAAGRELQVNSVLEGNVQNMGDRIRLSGRLINVTDGSSLWAGTFDEKFTDVFAVQDAISQKVADALALRLNGEEQNRLKKRYTDNVEAYQLYITGRYHWRKLIPPDLWKAISFFQQAIDLDPNYALAYFGLADAYRGLAPAADVPAKDILPQAKVAATKAVELDPSLRTTQPWLSFTLGLIGIGPVPREKRSEPLNLNPNWAIGHIAYAVLSHLGRDEEAIKEAARPGAGCALLIR
jgi:tetratricopeptide (TPR) repeat protein